LSNVFHFTEFLSPKQPERVPFHDKLNYKTIFSP
jgi:hypothetical protein